MDSSWLISAEGLVKTYGGRRILDGLDLKVLPREVLIVMGSSGAGKSVLLRHLAGLLRPEEGHIRFGGSDLVEMGESELNKVRLRFGMVFQFGALFNSLSVGDNVALALRYHRLADEAKIRQIVHDRLAEVGLEDAAGKRPGELSGGMRKRASLARALALEPEVIFYDEPTTGLDPVMCDTIGHLIKETNEKRGVTSVVVTHDVSLAFEIGDRIAMLYKGKICAVDEPTALRRSDCPQVREFLDRTERFSKAGQLR